MISKGSGNYLYCFGFKLVSISLDKLRCLPKSAKVSIDTDVVLAPSFGVKGLFRGLFSSGKREGGKKKKRIQIPWYI